MVSIISNGIFLCPLPANPLSILLVLLVMFCNIGGERVIWIWGAKQGLYRQQNGSDLKGRRPFIYKAPIMFLSSTVENLHTFQDIQTYSP